MNHRQKILQSLIALNFKTSKKSDLVQDTGIKGQRLADVPYLILQVL